MSYGTLRTVFGLIIGYARVSTLGQDITVGFAFDGGVLLAVGGGAGG